MPFLPPSLHFISPSSSGQRINFLFSFDLCHPYFFSLSLIREFCQVFPIFFPCLYSSFFAVRSTGLRFFFSRGRLSHTLCDGQVGVFFVISFYISLVSLFSRIYPFMFFLFFFFWAASLLCYTYIRETGHIEILYSLVAIHGSNGRSGHMGFWEWETVFFFGEMGYMDGTVLRAVDRSGISFFFTIQTTVSNTYR